MVIFSTISRDHTGAPPLSRACANFAVSSAVENSPACPATPPMARAVGSCTTARNTSPVFSLTCVGAVRASSDIGGRNLVVFMPSGPK